MRAEYNAFKDRLTSLPSLAGKVDTSIRTATNGDPVRANYVVAFPSVPDRLDDNRYTDSQSVDSSRLLTYDVRVVAVDADGVLLFAEAVTGRLIGHTLVVGGRRCEPITLVEGVEEGRVEWDKAARLFYLDMSFRFWSNRPHVP